MGEEFLQFKVGDFYFATKDSLPHIKTIAISRRQLEIKYFRQKIRKNCH